MPMVHCCAGSSYCFGVYSPALKASQRYHQSALNAVAFFKDVGANAGVLSGFLAAWARRRPWLVLLAGALLCAAGYLPMWLAVEGVAPAPLPLMCLYMLLAAQAQTFFNTADVVSAVENFPDRRGTVIGIMKAGHNCSASLLCLRPIICRSGLRN
ncbi:protein NUCLEAR FUSION DEFECTIVE 4-like [Miscanthus floridulus]|uniref:protein NUCLEAR FUSION DEFECTIVE 4-like n=1 Tax=Miscanthus floridulus TaxID=154761 RepID=UPI003459C802